MSNDPGPPPDEDDLGRRLRELAARVGWLEIEGARLRTAIEEQVRTRRVVVVDDAGRERIVLAAHGRFGHVTVVAASAGDDTTAVELFATDPVDGDGAEVGVAVIDEGDVVATLNVFEGRRAGLWVDEERPEPG
jgi:hypothetical protein